MTRIADSTVLVAGASGFIGGHLTRHLAAHGAQVRALIRPSSSTAGLDLPRVEIVIGEITHMESIRNAAEGCDVVVNAAGTMSGSAAQQRLINVDGARNLAAAAIAANARRLVHVSSAGIYGFRTVGDVDETTAVDPGPMAYPATKAEGETVVRQLAAEKGLSWSIIRPALVYGPGSTVLTKGLFRWARRRPIVFLGDGSGFAPIVHVDDVVEMIAILAAHDRAHDQVFNCAADPVPTWREFLTGYAALVGHSSWLGIPVGPVRGLTRAISKLAPDGTPPAELSSLVGFITGRRRFSVEKAAELLEWHPSVGLAEGIASCVPYLQEQGLLQPDARRRT
jgi:nucleoside-diphosphate-sugar epimerase